MIFIGMWLFVNVIAVLVLWRAAVVRERREREATRERRLMRADVLQLRSQDIYRGPRLVR